MQPSLFPFQNNVFISTHINYPDPPSEAAPPQHQWSTSLRLFAGLPRTPPSDCLPCGRLSIKNAHFATPHNLTSLLRIVLDTTTYELRLHNVTWEAHAHFKSDLTSVPLEISTDDSFDVVVRGSQRNSAEAAWLVFATRFRPILHTIPPALHHVSEKKIPQVTIIRVLPSAQRAIIGICTLLSRVPKLPQL